MKAIGFGTLTALGIALSLVTTGCHPEKLKTIPGTQHPTPVDVEPKGPVMPNLPPLPADTNVMSMVPLPTEPGHTNWTPHPEILQEQTIHFAYDSSAIRSADKTKVAAVADYLKQNPDAAVRVEGNCDERGTEEYNRSLGERRALAAREALAKLGVDPMRIITRSFGKDKPADPGHDESAWSKNRRDEFRIVSQ